MRYKISGKNIEVTPGLKDAVQEKIGKLERYFNQDTEANITLSVEKGRQKIEVTIPAVSYTHLDVYKRQTVPRLDTEKKLVKMEIKKHINM